MILINNAEAWLVATVATKTGLTVVDSSTLINRLSAARMVNVLIQSAVAVRVPLGSVKLGVGQVILVNPLIAFRIQRLLRSLVAHHASSILSNIGR